VSHIVKVEILDLGLSYNGWKYLSYPPVLLRWKHMRRTPRKCLEGLRGETETVGSFLEDEELNHGSALLK
jgi:hypothetical protein